MIKKFLTAAALVAATFTAFAADDGEKAARDAIHSLLPLAIVDQVVKSDLPGFYEVIISGQIVYVTQDGKYLLQGTLYDVPNKKDLTASRIATIRAQAIAKLPASKEMIFAPANPKYTVTVFTDVDCPYCRQFHKQIDEFNRAGIAVHYVLYPLDIHPGADKKAAAVWCADDRNSAYTAAMNGKDPGKGTCSNPVAETKALGVALGINATPTIIADDGSSIDSTTAMSPVALAAALEKKSAAKAEKPVATR